MSSRPLRFNPIWWQLAVLDAAAGAVCVALAMWLRFVDEGGVPPTYAMRLLPWMVLAAAVMLGAGRLIDRLRRPGSFLARRPVAPFLVAGAAAVIAVLAINDVLLREPWRLPYTVAVGGPLLAAAVCVALRLAAARVIEAEELLPRRHIQLDLASASDALTGKRVLITGAAGSIGSELTRQVLSLHPASVLAIDLNETGLYELEASTGAGAGSIVQTRMADVADERRMRELFERERPHVVFHAAAYKHVPLVEANPDQGFLSNVIGTLVVCEAALSAGAERVVVISTDKAVNPSSFMGLTKRVAELIVAAYAHSATATKFSAVRFGNVLGSRGSVVPVMLRQIETGGPVTITHPEARRFFMTISEAASLVLLSAAHGAAGGIFVLDMGDDVRIVDLAERLARLKGVRLGRDIKVTHVGLRPGEKLREELHSTDERLAPTDHPAVRRVVAAYTVSGRTVLERVRSLDAQRRAGRLDHAAFPTRLRELIEEAVTSDDQVQIAELVPKVST